MTLVQLLIVAIVLFAIALPAMAGKADVIDVKVRKEAGGTFGFDVTVKSDETGWDKYADKWDVVGPDGAVLGTRVLLHPHVDEQPFTRSLSGVAIPEGVEAVTLRAHDKVEGYGGREVTVKLPR
ncbi:MAG: hypothetical protein HC850_13300 [Rhodomicrobium sp.]|nr:hypothetical protein [Rhodomicrobium sp.]